VHRAMRGGHVIGQVTNKLNLANLLRTDLPSLIAILNVYTFGHG